VAFPITSELYLSQCCILGICDKANNNACWDMYLKNQNIELQFTSSDALLYLTGSDTAAPCYAKVFEKTKFNKPAICYFYLYSHTEPYKLCERGCALKEWAHLSDVKFIWIELTSLDNDAKINRIYFGAHGVNGGSWSTKYNIHDLTHPVAYVTKGDHSYYSDHSIHPRIYGIVCDITKYTFPIISSPVQVFECTDLKFNSSIMGWCYYPGNLNQNGVASPHNQWWWTGDIPEESNSWWKRLCCPTWF
jgi:hypothetical protein